MTEMSGFEEKVAVRFRATLLWVLRVCIGARFVQLLKRALLHSRADVLVAPTL